MACEPAGLRQLPPEVVSCIRSSVRIASLADVVRELVYNSIAARANRIDVTIDAATLSCRVADDGHGIPAAELTHLGERDCASRHASGRHGCGETLASLACLASLEVVSGVRGAIDALKVVWRVRTVPTGCINGELICGKGGERLKRSSSGRIGRFGPGTQISVRDLFYQWPVKRKQLLSAGTRQLDDTWRILELVALVHPSIAFAVTIEADAKRSARWLAQTSILARWRALWGPSLVQRCVPLDSLGNDIGIEGFMSLDNAKFPRHQLVFLNGQPVQASGLREGICRHLARSAAYRNLSSMRRDDDPAHSYEQPVFLLLLTCDTRYESPFDETFMVSHAHWKGGNFIVCQKVALVALRLALDASLRSAIDALLVGPHVSPMVQDKSGRARKASERVSPAHEDMTRPTRPPLVIARSSPAPRPASSRPCDVPGVGVEAYVDDMLHGWCDPRLPTRAQQSAGTDPPSLKKRHRHDAPLPAFAQRLYSPLSSLDYIGQVDRKFLAARSGGDIVLVDQHAADERIRVERYLDIILAPGPVPTDELAVSLVLDVDEARSLAETMDALAAWGVEVEVVDIDGVGEAVRARARTVPRLVAERCRAESGLVAALVRQHLEDVRERGRRLRPDRKDVASCPRVLLELLNSKACRGAIMFNDIVDDETAETLLRQLSTTRQPYQCAHGRPSLLALTELPEALDWKRGRKDGIDWRM